MITLTEAQIANCTLGLNDFIIIDTGSKYTGSFCALRLVGTDGVLVNDIDISLFNQFWNIGQYLYGHIHTVENNSDYPILAYNDGTKQGRLV